MDNPIENWQKRWRDHLRRGLGAARAVLAVGLAAAVISACTETSGLQDASVQSLMESSPPLPFDQIRDLMANGYYEESRAALDHRLLLEPADLEAHLLMGETLLSMEDPENALTHFLTARDAPGYRPQAQQGMGIALLRLGQTDDAIASLEDSVATGPASWRSYNALGVAYDQKMEWSKADTAYRKAQELAPDVGLIANNLGMSLLLQRRYDEAISEFQGALRIEPRLSAARSNLRIAYALQGRYLDAMAGVSPQNMADVLNNIGYVAMSQGDLDAAEAYLSRALEVSPAHHHTAARNLDELRRRRQINIEAVQSN